ncbi:sensor histidine kinase [Proteiniborus sp. DW1]|uniref:ATP-binding protein n=1 Tax=Proteiniborus sp. DW1 TaxID=1889883 RepID=UPI00092DF118|nr:ATP-binding protein [Proteiniborus sp. DW1]SCG81963.1 sensor histidine kinase [Proteiniborus sp. DW1]
MDRIQLHKINERLEFINELILDVAYRQSNEEVLDTALKKIMEMLQIDYGYVVSYTEIDKTIRNVEIQCNLPDGFLEEVINYRFENILVRDSIRDSMKKEVSIVSKEDLSTPYQKYISKKYGFETMIIVPIGFNDVFSTILMLLFLRKEKDNILEYVPLLETIGNTLWVLLHKQKIYREYQNNIIRTEKLKVLGELAGGIAHDFNNLLTTILGFSQIVLTRELSEDIRTFIDIIYKSAIDGKRIVERIQSFNRKQLGRSKEVHLINLIVESGIEMARPRWKHFYETHGNNLIIIKELKSNSKIYCVEHEIREVIINLLSNAMDAMEQGGTLTIKTYDEDDKVVIEISDTGPGISDEVREQIFEPFYSTKGVNGTGLGLSIVRDIINAHEGNIKLKSEIGKGSTFKLYFNKYIEKEDALISFDSDTDINLNLDKEVNILVVDDIPQVGNTVVEMLKTIGLHADIETESTKVIHRLLQKKYDIIVCDLAMPELNGISLSQQVKEKYSNIKFMILTGWPERLKKEDHNSIDLILRKPITMEELAQAIKNIL